MPRPEWDLSAEAATEVHRADPARGRRHGVYATPPALTRYVVRSVHSLLQDRFGLAAGLAHSSVRFLDPAAGPGNFLLEAWRIAFEEHRRQGGQGLAALIEGHLLPHSLGLELLPQPAELSRAAVRRFLAAQRIEDVKVPFPVVRADALAGPPPFPPEPGTVAVVLGNPPFTGGAAAPGWGSSLLAGCRPAGERCVRWLQGDAVRFLRLAQWVIERNGAGIAALVLPHALVAAPTFREVRRSLLDSFSEVWVLDLHGNRRRRERGPSGRQDESVFAGVAQGAAVFLAVRMTELGREKSPRGDRVWCADLWGTREAKLAALDGADVRSTPWTAARPEAPGFLLRGDGARADRVYRRGLSLPEIFPFRSTGLITGQDVRFTGLDRAQAEERLAVLSTGRGSPRFGDLTPFLVAPFDLRHLVYAPGLLARPRRVLERLLRRGGLALLATRGGEGAVFATRWLAGHKVVSRHDVNAVFPLYLETGPRGRRANLRPGLRAALASLYGRSPSPLAVFAYVYAVLHAPGFRQRCREELQEDFPRVPFPRRSSPFLTLAAAGRRLLYVHLLADSGLRHPPRLPGGGIQGLAPEVQAYRIGDISVLSRWLRARAGQPLGWSERRDLARIVEAVRLSLALEEALGRVYLDVEADVVDVAGLENLDAISEAA